MPALSTPSLSWNTGCCWRRFMLSSRALRENWCRLRQVSASCLSESLRRKVSGFEPLQLDRLIAKRRHECP